MKIGLINVPKDIQDVILNRIGDRIEISMYDKDIDYGFIKISNIELHGYVSKIRNIVLYLNNVTFDIELIKWFIFNMNADNIAILIDASEFTEEEHCLLDDSIMTLSDFAIILISDSKEDILQESASLVDMFQALLH